MAVAALASSHAINSLDPIDKVTIETVARYPKAQEYLKAGWKTKKFTPFDPVSKRIVAEVERDGVSYVACKGAPNSVLKLCQPPQEIADLYRQKAQEFAHRGFRSLGVAFQENGKWELLGIMPMFDPPRSDTAQTVQEAGVLGVKVKMLTGDAVAIAIETCKQLNLGTNVYDSERLISGGGMTGSDIHDFVEAADGFGEVYPEHSECRWRTARVETKASDTSSRLVASCRVPGRRHAAAERPLDGNDWGRCQRRSIAQARRLWYCRAGRYRRCSSCRRCRLP